ncbi:MAG: translation initiation factor IF-2 [Pirellulaceae bacterium]
MPIRIYALAKELQVDSKQLVEVCTKAGVTGKGSALASLDDDEVSKVKAYLGRGTGGGGAAGSREAKRTSAAPATLDEPLRPERPVVPQKKPSEIRTLSGGSPLSRVRRPDKTEPSEPSREESAAPETPPVAPPEPSQPAAPQQPSVSDQPASDQPTEIAAEKPRTPPADSPSTEPTTAETTPEEPAEDASTEQEPAEPTPVAEKRTGMEAIRRDDYISLGSTRKLRTLGQKGQGDDAARKDLKKPKKVGPVLKLAKMPTQAAPKVIAKPNEPAAQKPIMQLPKDAIKGAKQGQKAPLEEFTKLHEKKRKAKDRKSTADAGPGKEPVVDDDAAAIARGKKKGKGQPGLAGMAGSRDARTSGRRRTKDVATVGGGDDSDGGRYRRGGHRRHKAKKTVSTSAPRRTDASLELPCTIREFSEATGVPAMGILRTLMGLGTMANINSMIDTETAEMLAADFGVSLNLREAQSVEDTVISQIDAIEDAAESLKTRPPVVTFLGHVDHGKTSLLDKIIGLDVVSGEAGGITQHIRAYIVDKDGRKISFVDTPGHEAFTEMRARGANVTDIAVLIVAADDGVMPQTEEAISHAKAANVPIIVALNKMDVPGANPEKALQQLSQHGLLPAEWGGDVEVVKTSAMTGEGIDNLLETILLTAEIHEYTANPDRAAMGVCLEAAQDSDQGVMVKVIVKNGSLKVGDVVVCGTAHGRVKAMYDTLDARKRLDVAPPSTPINLSGLESAPQAGEKFYVLSDVAEAREIAQLRRDRTRQESLGGTQVKVSFEDFQARLQSGNFNADQGVTNLNIILRADTRGSIEAIMKELDKLDHPEVKVRVIQSTVGGVTVADATLASASEAVIVAFNVIPDEAARALAEERGVEIRRYDIIYKVSEDIKLLLEGKLRPEKRVTELGRALVQRVFSISRLGAIAGCRVLGGTIERGCRIRVNRDGRGIGDYPLDSLKREKDDTKEVREGYECGIKLSGFNDIKEGDILEAFKVEEFARTLESSQV